jgi:hypothetical protein
MQTRRAMLSGLGALTLLSGCQIASAERLGVEGVGDLRAGGQFAGRFVWAEVQAGFGGISALHLDADGARFMAVGDRGLLWQGRFQRGTGGQITGVTGLSRHVLRGPEGQPLPRGMADAEGIARGPDGRIYIAFEGPQPRIAAYDRPDAPARTLPVHPDFARLTPNQSLEALACDARGRLYTVPEGAQTGQFAVYRFDGQAWLVVGQIPMRDGFVPVGADFGPDGMFYLLERRFRSPLFASRVSRIRPDAWQSPQTIFQSPLGALDNHEGLAVSRPPVGRLRLTLVSDDNFNRFQRTEIVEVIVA